MYVLPMIWGIMKDLLHVCVTIVVSFYVCLRFNRDTPSSLDGWLTDAPWDAFWMNVYQVMVTTLFGNSVLAWVVAALFVCVDNQDMGVLDEYVREHFGGYYDGNAGWAMAILAFLCFLIPYLVHGFLLLPLELSVYAKRFKIQPEQTISVDRALLWNVMESVLNLIVFGVPYVLLIMGVSVWTGGQYGVQLSGPLPSFMDRVWLLGVNILISEVLFYHMHRLLHTKHLYRLVHKKHHHYKAPFALCAIYCHPFELVVGNLIPVTLGLVLTRAHIFFVFVWITGSALTTSAHHSGYRLPWMHSTDHQPEFHDAHHLYFCCNYGMIGLCDAFYGTIHRETKD